MTPILNGELSQASDWDVLVHYFGYLRRNPDDAPDFDLKGLNFWRDRLDGWGDYRTISRAFIESLEYKELRPVP